MHLPSCPQVYLAPDGSSAEYGSVLVEINKRIKKDLVLAADLASLYAMTQDKVGLWSLGGGALVVQPLETRRACWEGPNCHPLGPDSVSQAPFPSLRPFLAVLCLRPGLGPLLTRGSVL